MPRDASERRLSSARAPGGLRDASHPSDGPPGTWPPPRPGLAGTIAANVYRMSTPDEALLNEHLAAENAHDLDRIMATYVAAPVIELNGSRIEGLAAVREFHRSFGFGGGQGSFSEVRVIERARHRAPAAIIIEQTLTGVHTGTWRGVGPTGRVVSVSVCTVFSPCRA